MSSTIITIFKRLIMLGILLFGVLLVASTAGSNDDRPSYPDAIFPVIVTSDNVLPVCGNGQCERYNEISELESCQQDCNFDTPIQKPVCGNGICESFGGVDEFVTCGWGTVNDCDVQCSSAECWVDYCPQGCSSDAEIIVGFPSEIYNIKVIYAYNLVERDEKVINSIASTIKLTSELLNDYNGMTIIPTIVPVQISYDIGDGHDIYYPYVERQLIWKEINRKIDLEADISNFDGIWLILAGTTGGAFVIDYKSPIYFDGDHFGEGEKIYGQYLRSILTAHEFLHNFGCKDINAGKPGCIMGDLKVTTISESTLCECAQLFIPANYGRHTQSEYLGGDVFSLLKPSKELVITDPLIRAIHQNKTFK